MWDEIPAALHQLDIAIYLQEYWSKSNSYCFIEHVYCCSILSVCIELGGSSFSHDGFYFSTFGGIDELIVISALYVAPLSLFFLNFLISVCSFLNIFLFLFLSTSVFLWYIPFSFLSFLLFHRQALSSTAKCIHLKVICDLLPEFEVSKVMDPDSNVDAMS